MLPQEVELRCIALPATKHSMRLCCEGGLVIAQWLCNPHMYDWEHKSASHLVSQTTTVTGAKAAMAVPRGLEPTRGCRTACQHLVRDPVRCTGTAGPSHSLLNSL